MEIQFDTSIDDLAEHHFRLFIRSRAYKKNRWFGVGWSFLGVGAVFLILKSITSAELPMWLPLMLGGIGAILYFVFYPEITKRNIKKYLTKKYIAELPCTTTYTIKDGHIICKSLNKDSSFDISELVYVAEDEKQIELSFGPKDLVLIPIRAFESMSEIDQFKNILKSE